MLPIIYFVLVIFWCSVWGVATNAIIQNKGYSENWFWWGFFFSLIAVLVALSKPQVQNSEEDAVRKANEKREQAMLSDNGWKCDKCGKMNPSYTGTCGCGLTRAQSEARKRQREEEKKKVAEVKKESDAIEKIKQYKELLDSGILSQEEFDKKKAELLHL